MKLSPVSLASFLLLTQGCASVPHSGVIQANGQPLDVREETRSQEFTYQEKVGEVEHVDSSGRHVGTSNVYATRHGVTHYKVWNGYQGNQKLVDDDFFRIGGDKEAADDIKSSREAGVVMNRVGLGIFGVGLAAMIGGYVVGKEGTALRSGLVYGGAIAVPVGGILTYLGLAKANAEHPLDDQNRAWQVAADYNQRLAAQPAALPAASQSEAVALTSANVPVSAGKGPVAAPAVPSQAQSAPIPVATVPLMTHSDPDGHFAIALPTAARRTTKRVNGQLSVFFSAPGVDVEIRHPRGAAYAKELEAVTALRGAGKSLASGTYFEVASGNVLTVDYFKEGFHATCSGRDLEVVRRSCGSLMSLL